MREYMENPVSTLDFWAMLEGKLGEEWEFREYVLSDADRVEISRIYAEKYGNPDWTLGRTPQFSIQVGRRFSGGKIELFLDVIRGEIADCTICGDFLGTASIERLEGILQNLPFTYDAVKEALSGVDLRPYLGGISMDEVLSCMFGEGGLG